MVWMKVPYTNFHNLNQDWIVHKMMEFEEYMEHIVQISVIKYADPIQWRITGQYEQSTVVIDAETGIAYISVQPVPAGIAITNTNYWTPVFDLQQILGDIDQQIRDETTAREAADQTLQDNIDDEQTAREAADQTLQDNIDDEEAARILADQDINNRISTLESSALVINVKEYGAAGDGTTDDTAALTAALAAAGDEKCTVFFPKGVYSISDPVDVKSNTTLYFDDAEILVIRTDSTWKKLSFSLGEYGNLNYSSGYNGVHDVEFINMKFNGGYNASFTGTTHGGGNIGLNHCRNIKFTGCTFSNIPNDHYIDVAGSRDVWIQNCIFNGGTYLGSDDYEAINIDWSTEGGFPHFGVFDNTNSINVFIESCVFQNFIGTGNPCGVGTHDNTSTLFGHRAVYVLNNRFYNMHMAAHFLNYFDSMFKNNYLEQCAKGSWANTSDAYSVLIQACQTFTFNENIVRDSAYGVAKVENRGGSDTTYVNNFTAVNNVIRHAPNNPTFRVRYINGCIVNNNMFNGSVGTVRLSASNVNNLSCCGNVNFDNGGIVYADTCTDILIMSNVNSANVNDNLVNCSDIVHQQPGATTITNS